MHSGTITRPVIEAAPALPKTRHWIYQLEMEVTTPQAAQEFYRVLQGNPDLQDAYSPYSLTVSGRSVRAEYRSLTPATAGRILTRLGYWNHRERLDTIRTLSFVSMLAD
jgi:hypothetical protein